MLLVFTSIGALIPISCLHDFENDPRLISNKRPTKGQMSPRHKTRRKMMIIFLLIMLS